MSTPSWAKRLRYDRYSPRQHSGLWIGPTALLLAGAMLYLGCSGYLSR